MHPCNVRDRFMFLCFLIIGFVNVRGLTASLRRSVNRTEAAVNETNRCTTPSPPHPPPTHASQEVCSLARSFSRKKRTISATLSFAVPSLQTCNVESIFKRGSWFGVESWDLLGVWVESWDLLGVWVESWDLLGVWVESWDLLGVWVESWDLLGVWVESGVKYDAVDYMLCIETLFPNACIDRYLFLALSSSAVYAANVGI